MVKVDAYATHMRYTFIFNSPIMVAR